MTEHYKHEHKADINDLGEGLTARRIQAGQPYLNPIHSGFPHPWISNPPFIPPLQPLDLEKTVFVETDAKTDKSQQAHTFLEEAGTVMKERAKLRDKPEGERSMEAIVKTFNALTGKNLTEAEGWEFMLILKMVRGRQGSFHRDDYVDLAAYSGLLGECESTARK